MSRHIDVIPKSGSPPSILLREAKRDGVKIRKKNLANLSKLPTSLVDHIRVLIKGGVAFDSLNAAFKITRSWPHGHVFPCALACHIEWHLRQQLAPLLFEEDDPEGAQAQRQNPVEPTQHSDRACRKAQSKQTEEGLKVHSLPTLFADLQTVVLNTVEFNTHGSTIQRRHSTNPATTSV